MVPAQNLSKQQQHHHHLLLLHESNNKKLDNISADVDYCYGNNNNINISNLIKYRESVGDLIMSREGYDNCTRSSTTESCLGSDLLVGPMAEDESRTNSLNEAGSTSKDDAQEADRDQGWLQLSIGGNTAGSLHSHEIKNHHQVLESTAARISSSSSSGGLNNNNNNNNNNNMIELDLLPAAGGAGSSREAAATGGRPSSTFEEIGFGIGGGGPSSAHPRALLTNFGTNFSNTSLMYFQQYNPTSSNFPQSQDHLNWAFRPLISQNINTTNNNNNNNIIINVMGSTTTASTSSTSLMPHLGSSYFGRQFQLQPPLVVDAPTAGPSTLDFRVVNPPRRPHSGIWFMLQASRNQAKEPFLPQISKSFLRIKDGGMTVRLLIKYLVNKLRLDSESEIEITCRGQQLLPFLTLQHVRDNIWGPTVTLLPDSSSSTTDHIMVLHYARSA